MSPADLLQRAQAAGLLPPEARWPSAAERPWPVVLLTAVGAWFAAVPLLIFIGVLMGAALRESAGLALVGGALIALAVVLLRSRSLPLFLEQLAVPALLVGLLCVGWRLFESLGDKLAAITSAALCLGLAVVLPAAWLRALLGAAAAACCLWLARPAAFVFGTPNAPLWGLALLMILLWALLHRIALPPRWAQAWESTGAGWLALLLCALAAQSGSPFLVAGLLPWQDGQGWGGPALTLASLGVALASVALLARAWPDLRAPRWLALGGLLALPAAVLPALGPLALAAALSARARRWRLCTLAGLAAFWVLGSFYYLLAWPLAHKALSLIVLGLLVAAVVRPAWASQGGAVASGGRRPAIGALLALGLTLGVANVGIVQKERLIAQGETVFVPLAPADPRSLMQGDFMRLNFGVPPDLVPPLESALGAARPKLVLRLDARGVARFVRADTGAALAADERRVELSPKDGRWTLVTDAWFFREGEASRWEKARFGEFRLSPDGKALLVNLRDADLQAL